MYPPSSLFGQISINWRGKPLVSYEVMVELIGHTTTTTGLRVHAAVDACNYPPGIKVTDEELANVQLTGTASNSVPDCAAR